MGKVDGIFGEVGMSEIKIDEVHGGWSINCRIFYGVKGLESDLKLVKFKYTDLVATETLEAMDRIADILDEDATLMVDYFLLNDRYGPQTLVVEIGYESKVYPSYELLYKVKDDVIKGFVDKIFVDNNLVGFIDYDRMEVKLEYSSSVLCARG